MKKNREKNKEIKIIEKAKPVFSPLCAQSTHIAGCTAGVVARP